MPKLDKAEILRQIDLALDGVQQNKDGLRGHFMDQYVRAYARARDTLVRLAPSNSQFLRCVKEIESTADPKARDVLKMNEGYALIGSLSALRDAYEDNCLGNIEEMVRADIFADLLDQAEHLLEMKYHIPAAVLIGSVLEEHLRKLCESNSVDVTDGDGKHIKASAMNVELAKKSVYSKGAAKDVTSWQDIRNAAAHGQWNASDEREKGHERKKVDILLQSIRLFLNQYPA